MNAPAGAFSPIEDVVREAEERVQREWDREHTPCPHSGERVEVMERTDSLCLDCREWIPSD